MCLPFPKALLLMLVMMLGIGASDGSARGLVVCADPDDMPYSRSDRSGFENRLMALLAQDMGIDVEFHWQPLRRGEVRKTIGAGMCDLIAGVPIGLGGVACTIPYYRSSYVYVTRADFGAAVQTLDDRRLARSVVGVPLIGGEGAVVPAAMALATRGLTNNVRGFPVYGNQPAAQRMIEALDRREIDVAVGWGPRLAYFAHLSATSLTVASAPSVPGAMQDFDIAIGVRPDEPALRDALNAALTRQQPAIRALLAEYNVPVVDRVVGRAEQP
jgi:mxaJ protein